MPYVGNYTLEDIREGMEFEQEYHISPVVYESFLAAFHDRSPIHVDEVYARANGFEGHVMQGAILNGFLSEFLGIHFPGRRSLLLSSDMRYHKPCYLGERLRLKATVTKKIESKRVIVLNLVFHSETQRQIVARGRVQVGVRVE